MSKRRWKQISLTLSPQMQDLLAGQLSQLGFSGYQQEDDSLLCFIVAQKWTKKFESSFQKVLSNFRKEFPSTDILYAVSDIEEKNWNAEWEKTIGIVEVTDRTIIKPSWKKLRAKDKGKLVLHIDPKMSFGTGHHETTRLSLVLLESWVQLNSKVLDFGTGSGILAIAAAKLGARQVIAIDNDPWAIESAKENSKRNRVDQKIKLKLGGIEKLPKSSFNLIVCNVDYLFLCKNLSKLIRPLRNGGDLIISGLMNSDLTTFLDLIKGKSIFPIEILCENEWAAIHLSKANAHRGS